MVTAESILISSNGIKNSLKKYKALQSVSEYLWNGFDAKATCLNIDAEIGRLGQIELITISDNGYGIDKGLLKNKFQPFFQSEKIYEPTIKHSATHGKNGVGRLTFFTFASRAEWETTYEAENQKNTYKVTVDADNLDQYRATEEQMTNEATGTKVTLYNIFNPELTIDTITDFLAKEFCWFLELNKNKNYAIVINGKHLDYSNKISMREEFKYVYKNTGTEYTVTFICWTHKLDEYSKYYYINSEGVEKAKENTTFNNKGDHFYHSVFIKSKLFNEFDFTKDALYGQQTCYTTKNKKSPEYIFIINEVNKLLIDKRRPFLKEYVSIVIENLDIKSAFPNFNAKNPMDQYRVSQIEEMVSNLYIAQPKIFSTGMNKEQKKTFIRLLDLIMESGEIDTLFNILNEILEMDTDEREELSEILKFTRMSNITKTIKLIKDRYQAVSDLKSLVFKKELNANEVTHVQGFIEEHYWLFGEQYNLVTAAEPNFVEALRRFKYILYEEYTNAEVEHEDRLKQMDIYAIRQDVTHGIYNNIVVELKHPDIPLGEKQLSQVKKYMDVVLSVDDFNAANMQWEFYLIGNKFNQNGYIEREIENNKHHGLPSLVFNVKNYKIYVKTWSEVFADFEMRHAHLNRLLNIEREKLQIDYKNADQVLKQQEHNTAIMPKEIQIRV